MDQTTKKVSKQKGRPRRPPPPKKGQILSTRDAILNEKSETAKKRLPARLSVVADLCARLLTFERLKKEKPRDVAVILGIVCDKLHQLDSKDTPQSMVISIIARIDARKRVQLGVQETQTLEAPSAETINVETVEPIPVPENDTTSDNLQLFDFVLDKPAS